MRIAVYEIMHIGLYAHALKTMAILISGTLAVVVGYNHRPHHEAASYKLVAQAQDVLIIGYAEVGTNLVALYVLGTDDDDYLYLVANLAEHAQLGVWLETRQHPAGMMVVKQFATQLKVKLSLELCYPLLNMLRLYAEIFVVIKSYFHLFTLFFY